jgi:hypothetical protein
MATYTDANAIKKIGTGDEAGTWGTSTNNNFDIIDRAANGFVSIVLSGTSYTLALSTTAVLSNGHYKAIKFTGSPGGTCTVTLEQNDRARMYMILNSTDQALVITQGSGGNTTIATGKSAIVLADGAGAGAAVTDYTSTLSNLQGPAISSPTMTGSPTAPTPSAGTNNTLLATTAFVANAIPSSAITFTDNNVNVLNEIVMSGGASNWTFEVDGSNRLVIQYGGTSLMRLDSSGNLTVIGDVTAFGSL